MTPIPEAAIPAPPRALTPEMLHATRAVAAQRWRVAVVLTTGMVLSYFGFLALVAFSPARLGELVMPGLSLGILLGAAVIVIAWLLKWRDIRWAGQVYDPALEALRAARDAADEAPSRQSDVQRTAGP